MDTAKLLFFNQRTDALSLYETLEQRICSEIEQVTVKVQKTQISFYNRHMFACVSFAKVRRKAHLPNPYLVVTFGLDHRVMSDRIDVSTEPYPNRWTHHVTISALSDIDQELLGWIKEASVFAANKR